MATLHPYLGVSKQKGYKTWLNNRYNTTKIKRYGIHVNKRTEKDIMKWLEANKPYATAVKKLIREQIKKEKLEKKEK